MSLYPSVSDSARNSLAEVCLHARWPSPRRRGGHVFAEALWPLLTNTCHGRRSVNPSRIHYDGSSTRKHHTKSRHRTNSHPMLGRWTPVPMMRPGHGSSPCGGCRRRRSLGSSTRATARTCQSTTLTRCPPLPVARIPLPLAHHRRVVRGTIPTPHRGRTRTMAPGSLRPAPTWRSRTLP